MFTQQGLTMLPRQRLHLSASNMMLTQMEEESSNLNPGQSVVRARLNNRSAPTSLSTVQSLSISPGSFSSLNSRGKGKKNLWWKQIHTTMMLSLHLQSTHKSWLKAECPCERGDQTSSPTWMEIESLAFLLAVGSVDHVKLQIQIL